MVNHDFPLFRLATLLARQFSSPIATKIKEHVREHPLFTRALCMRTARSFRAVELRCRLWSLRVKQPAVLPPISDREAVNMGADLLGEIVIFVIGAAIVTFEVNRQAMNKEASRLVKKSRWVAIGVALEELQHELVLQQREIDALLATLRSLHGGPGAEPHAPTAPPLKPDATMPNVPYNTPTPEPSAEFPSSEQHQKDLTSEIPASADVKLPPMTPAIDLPYKPSHSSPEPEDSSSNIVSASADQPHKAPYIKAPEPSCTKRKASPADPPVESSHPPVESSLPPTSRRPVVCYPGETPRPHKEHSDSATSKCPPNS